MFFYELSGVATLLLTFHLILGSISDQVSICAAHLWMGGRAVKLLYIVHGRFKGYVFIAFVTQYVVS